MAKVLTAPTIAKMKPRGNRTREVPDARAPGLYLQIYPSGKQSWALRYRRPDGRPNKLVLGTVNLIGDGKRDADPVIGGHLTLSAVRRLAATLRHQIALGKDPAAIHRAEKQAVALSAADTFAAAAIDFINQYAKKKTRHWKEQARLLGLDANGDLELIEKGLASRWRDKPLAEITDDDLFRLIEEVRHRGTPGLARKKSEASEPRARIMYATLSKMFNWLLEKRRIKASPMANLKRPAPLPDRDRVLTDGEIIAFWRATDDMPKPFAAVLKLLLLTGCRREEVAGMEVKELSGDGLVWTIPSRRTKNRRVHVVPLPPLARAVIADAEQLPDCAYIFSTNQRTPISGFSKVKKRLDSQMRERLLTSSPRLVNLVNNTVLHPTPWRLHDLRRTAATGMAELGIQPHIIELCLNHVSGHKGGIAGVYNRSENMPQRRAALEQWADHIVGLVGDRQSGGEDERRVSVIQGGSQNAEQ
jgi:integrase